MAVYEFEGKKPVIERTAYVCKEAVVIGNVRIGKQCFIAPGAVIRGDYGTIIIGDKTSVQDNAVIHALDNGEVRIGEYVQLAHGSLLHNCFVDDYAIIGIGAIVGDYARVGRWAIVAPGAVVASKQEILAEAVFKGNPARFLRMVTEKDKERWLKYKDEYPKLASPRYPKGLKRVVCGNIFSWIFQALQKTANF